MADLILSGVLNLTGKLDLIGTDGGKVKVDNNEAIVEDKIGSKAHSKSAVPVLIPPQVPIDPGTSAYIFLSFNSTITANGKNIVTMGMFKQGNQQTWPGMVNQSILNPAVKINGVPINVMGDMGTTLPNGGPVTFDTSGQ